MNDVHCDDCEREAGAIRTLLAGSPPEADWDGMLRAVRAGVDTARPRRAWWGFVGVGVGTLAAAAAIFFFVLRPHARPAPTAHRASPPRQLPFVDQEDLDEQGVERALAAFSDEEGDAAGDDDEQAPLDASGDEEDLSADTGRTADVIENLNDRELERVYDALVKGV
jgi:hypothetical protein